MGGCGNWGAGEQWQRTSAQLLVSLFDRRFSSTICASNTHARAHTHINALKVAANFPHWSAGVYARAGARGEGGEAYLALGLKQLKESASPDAEANSIRANAVL